SRLRKLEGVADATLFGQTIHLLADERITEGDVCRQLDLREGQVPMRPIAPSLEDVFVTLTRAQEGRKKAESGKPKGEGGEGKAERGKPRKLGAMALCSPNPKSEIRNPKFPLRAPSGAWRPCSSRSFRISAGSRRRFSSCSSFPCSRRSSSDMRSRPRSTTSP